MGDITDWMHQAGLLDPPRWGDDDEEPEEDDHPLSLKRTRRRCGKTGLTWSFRQNSWRLMDHTTGQPHYCPAALASEFDNLPTT